MKRFCSTLVCAVVGAALLAGLGGCEQLNPRPPVDLATPIYAPPTVVPVVRPSNGAIYQSGQYRPLFEDHRARLVGDSLTVQIVEKISATQKSTSSIDKSGKLSAGITALPLISPNSFGRASAAATSSNTFAGAGTTDNSNDFSGTITAVVTGVLPNGHLLVAGEKQIGINQGSEFIRLSGVVNPRFILAGNIVSSTTIADARLEYRGTGYLDEAQTMGWLSRIFMTVMPF